MKDIRVKTPKGYGFIIDDRGEKVKVQLEDSVGFLTYKKDWFESKDVVRLQRVIIDYSKIDPLSDIRKPRGCGWIIEKNEDQVKVYYIDVIDLRRCVWFDKHVIINI